MFDKTFCTPTAMQPAIIALCVYLVSARESFISLRDRNCDQEDPRIVAELKRRMNHDALIRVFKPVKHAVSTPAEREKRRSLGQSTLLPPQVTKYRSNFMPTGYHNDFEERVSMHKMVEIVEQAIYNAQYRIKDLEPYVAKYLEKNVFRIGFMLMRLEALERELHYIYTHMYYKGKVWDAWSGSKMSVFVFIVYYEMVLRKHVDIQYMVDHLFRLHKVEQKKMDEYRSKKLEPKDGAASSNESGVWPPAGYTGTTPPGWKPPAGGGPPVLP